MRDKDTKFVATVPTVYGIETIPTRCGNLKHLLTGKLQQYLPFTVLKLRISLKIIMNIQRKLQQYLPFTVLKLIYVKKRIFIFIVATVLTVYGIETP